MPSDLSVGSSRRNFITSGALFCAGLRTGWAQRGGAIDIAVTSEPQVNGVASAKDGRVFVSLPRWIDMNVFSTGIRMPNGTLTAYPGGSWNTWQHGSDPSQGFICVNAVHIDPLQPEKLWVVDAAAPAFGKIVPGGPKLVAIDLDSNRVVNSYQFAPEIVPTKGYLNDVRFAHDHAFLTESGTGAILVIDLTSGKARRLLADSPSTKAVSGRRPTVDGRRLATPNGGAPKINCDGIEISQDREWLLFAVPFGGWLWRIRIADLLNEKLSSSELAAKVERLTPLMAIGGMTLAPDGGLLLSDVEQHAIVHRAQDGILSTIVKSPLLQWPDASALDSKGALLVASSQVNHLPAFNDGQNSITRPFHVLRINLG